MNNDMHLFAIKPFVIRYDAAEHKELRDIRYSIMKEESQEEYLTHRSRLRELSKLLAHSFSVRSALQQEHIWPPFRIMTTVCGKKHEQPVANCNCGVMSSFDLAFARKYIEEEQKSYDDNVVIRPILGVIQVLGHTEVDKTTKTLRSWGGLLYGLLQPAWLDNFCFEQLWEVSILTYKFVQYETLDEIERKVYTSWRNYGLL